MRGWEVYAIFLVGALTGAMMSALVPHEEEPPEVVLPAIRVPAPWGACRVSSGPHRYRSTDAPDAAEDSAWVSLVCPDDIQVP